MPPKRLEFLLLDKGEKPAVISAIMKYYCTENARTVLNHGMDIYAGSGICDGPNNFIKKFYQSAPVGITVEGSNTLTKNLIILKPVLISCITSFLIARLFNEKSIYERQIQIELEK